MEEGNLKQIGSGIIQGTVKTIAPRTTSLVKSIKGLAKKYKEDSERKKAFNLMGLNQGGR